MQGEAGDRQDSAGNRLRHSECDQHVEVPGEPAQSGTLGEPEDRAEIELGEPEPGDAVRVRQLSFSIDDDSAVRAKARADAVKQAQAQARQLAEAAGVRLGKLRSISESAAAQPPPGPLNRGYRDAAARPVPVQPGTQKPSVSVDVVYDIDQ